MDKTWLLWLWTGLLMGSLSCATTYGDPAGDDDVNADDDDAVDDDAVDDDDTAGDDDTEPTGPPPDPAEAGSYSWSTTTAELLVDGVWSTTTIPLTNYLPDGAGPFPVVVFAHGFQLSSSDYRSYGEHLASWGFVVIMPDLPGSMFVPETHAALRDYMVALLDWVEVNAGVAGGPLDGVADLSRLGISGHSMGGKIALLTAATDARPDAAFVLDPVDSGSPFGNNPVDYPSVTPELMPQLQIPLGLLGETVNATGGMGGQSCAPAEENFQQYFEYATSPAIEIEALGASHMSFLDNPDCGFICDACPDGTDDPVTTRRLARGTMTAFYNVQLQGAAEFMEYLTGEPMDEAIAAGLAQVRTANGF